MNQKGKLLLTMLSCGTADLEMLEDVNYDWNEVLEQLDWPDGEGFVFNGLMRAVVDVGIIYIKDAADDRICKKVQAKNILHTSFVNLPYFCYEGVYAFANLKTRRKYDE